MSARFRSRFGTCKMVVRASERRSEEEDPFCPPHSAAMVYCVGSVLEA